MTLLTLQNWKQQLRQGFNLQSSGTTGTAKVIFQSPDKLRAANRVALEAQNMSVASRVLTLCRMDHAGGALAQTLPALSIGAYVDIRPFNAYSFWQHIRGFTHTHLTPQHCRMLMNTRSFQAADFNGLFLACGSDNVDFDIIEAFVSRGAVFMCNWGMTEIGPITINTVFDSLSRVHAYREMAVDGGTLMGDRCYCDWKILDGELWVRGDTCVYDDWFNTRDRVVENAHQALYHMGRH